MYARGMIAKKYGLATLAVELGTNPRSLAKRLADLEPDEAVESRRGTERKWYLARVVKHLAGSSSDSGGSRGKILDLSAERARLASEQADKTALENARRRGELLEVNVVGRAWEELMIGIKARFMALPTKMAAELSTLTDANEIRKRLTDEVTDILEEASNFDPTSEQLRGEDPPEEDSGDPETPAEPERKRLGRSVPKAKPRKQRRTRAVADR